jgi:aarF domain-containing kinase
MWASRALAENKNASLGQRWKEYGRHLLFRTVLITTDFVFYWSKLKQLFGFGKGMDDDIEESMRKMASRYVLIDDPLLMLLVDTLLTFYDSMGVELNHGVFEG